MSIVIKGNIHLEKPFTIHNNSTSLVILGNLSSSQNISFRVKNLVVLGSIITHKTFSGIASSDIFNIGKIGAENIKMKAPSIHNGLSPLAVQKINAIGIEGLRLDNNEFSFEKPNTTESKT